MGIITGYRSLAPRGFALEMVYLLLILFIIYHLGFEVAYAKKFVFVLSISDPI